MIIVRIDGGLGNQMFCYAFAIALRESLGKEVLIDSHRYKFFPNHTGYELNNLFDITIKEATNSQLWKMTNVAYCPFMNKIFYYLPKRRTEIIEDFTKCYPNIIEEHRSGYYIGNWQWYKYFDKYKDAVLKELTFKQPLDKINDKLYRQLLMEPYSISIHVRRGDYMSDPKYSDICDLDYYVNAISRAKAIVGLKRHFVVFSNDMTWCEEYIRPLINDSFVTFVDWNTGMDSNKDMRIMQACRINIIANSSFSWWAAYMNKRNDKYVIAPKTWINLPLNYHIQCEEWECI